MKIGPQYKICKRLGSPIFEKCQTQKFALSEARSAKNKRGGKRKSLSNYGAQLLEKQKVRFTYGLTEKQFSRYVEEAIQQGGNSMDNLYRLLEARLDNVVYRMGLAKTRRMARQLVSHGHFTVNGTKMTIPSYQVKKDDVISIREGSRGASVFGSIKESAAKPSPWLRFDEGKLEGGVTEFPSYNVTSELFDLKSVIEFYSR